MKAFEEEIVVRFMIFQRQFGPRDDWPEEGEPSEHAPKIREVTECLRVESSRS